MAERSTQSQQASGRTSKRPPAAAQSLSGEQVSGGPHEAIGTMQRAQGNAFVQRELSGPAQAPIQRIFGLENLFGGNQGGPPGGGMGQSLMGMGQNAMGGQMPSAGQMGGFGGGLGGMFGGAQGGMLGQQAGGMLGGAMNGQMPGAGQMGGFGGALGGMFGPQAGMLGQQAGGMLGGAMNGQMPGAGQVGGLAGSIGSMIGGPGVGSMVGGLASGAFNMFSNLF